MTVSSDGKLFILNSQSRKVFKFTDEGIFLNSFDVKDIKFPVGLGVDSKEEVFLGEAIESLESVEHNKFIFGYDNKGNLIKKVSGMKGNFEKIAVDNKDNMLVYNREINSITIFN